MQQGPPPPPPPTPPQPAGLSRAGQAVLWVSGIATVVAIGVGIALIGADDGGPRSAQECADQTDPSVRLRAMPRGIAAETPDAQTQAKIRQTFSGNDDFEYAVRRVSKQGVPLGAALVMTVGDGQRAREEFTGGINERAQQHGSNDLRRVALGKAEDGHQVTLKTPEGDAVLAYGFAGCHAVAGVSLDGQTARDVAAAMAAAGES